MNNSDIGLIIGFYDEKNILQIASIYEVMDGYIITDLQERVAKKDIVDVGFVDLNKHDQLQARIKELENDKHINEIKAQGIEEIINSISTNERFGFEGFAAIGKDNIILELKQQARKLRTKHD